MSDDLLKWVADFLKLPKQELRGVHAKYGPAYEILTGETNEWITLLQFSVMPYCVILMWLVIAEMRRKTDGSFGRFYNTLTTSSLDWWMLEEPWIPVFTAARRAVEGVTSDGGSNDGS
jgi:hypothetical protein